MKTLLLSVLVLSLGMSAARATDTTPASDANQNAQNQVRPETRTIELTGLNGRVTIVVNDSRTPLNSQAPYALQGSGSARPASPSGQGYQAR